MKEVIRIDGIVTAEKKPVEFTHCLRQSNRWFETDANPSDYERIVYLGKCNTDGDMFAAYFGKKLTTINIFKGHLNSGKY